MKKIFVPLACVLTIAAMNVSCSKDDNGNANVPTQVDEVSYKIISKEEAKQYFVNEKLHDQITPYFMDMAMMKDGAERREWQEMALSKIQDPQAERQAFLDSIARMQTSVLRNMGISLPIPKQVEIIDMTMEAFGSSSAFTSGTRIYANIHALMHPKENMPDLTEYIMWHEMWHVISRNNPDLRKKMFELIGFTVMDEEIEIPAEVKSHILCNPDVERHDSYATFKIDGKPTDCMLMLYAKEDKFMGFTLKTYLGDALGYWLLALDPVTHKPYRNETGEWVIYNCMDASDFFDVMSGNTRYCDDPEECMADNFSFAMMNDTTKKNQTILQNIRDLMKQQSNR